MKALIPILLALLLCSCSRKTAPVVVRQTHTTLSTDSLTHLIKIMMSQQSSQREKETVYVYDKTTYTVNENGDTTGTEHDRVTERNREWESEERYYQHVIDSLKNVIGRVDSVSVPVPYPVEKVVEVERKRRWWETALIWCGGIAMVIGGAATWWLYRRR